MHIRSPRRCTAAFGAAGLALSALLPAVAAHADVKLVTQTTYSGLGSSPKAPVPGAVYYKGDKQRTELNGQVTIFDCATDTLYTLNPKDKTYTVTVGVDEAGTQNPMLAMLKIEAKDATLTQLPATKQIAGKAATGYDYSVVLQVRPKDPSLTDFLPSFTTTIKGQQWTTGDIPSAQGCVRMARLALTQTLPTSLVGSNSSLKALTDKAAQIKGLPLSNKVQVTLKQDGKSDAGINLPKDPIVITTDVTSVDESALDDSLFAIPADYKKIERPAVPGAPPAAGAPAGSAAPAVSAAPDGK